VSWALRAVDRRNTALNVEAVAVARRLRRQPTPHNGGSEKKR
jgi:hypothetical protein